MSCPIETDPCQMHPKFGCYFVFRSGRNWQPFGQRKDGQKNFVRRVFHMSPEGPSNREKNTHHFFSQIFGNCKTIQKNVSLKIGSKGPKKFLMKKHFPVVESGF